MQHLHYTADEQKDATKSAGFGDFHSYISVLHLRPWQQFLQICSLEIR